MAGKVKNALMIAAIGFITCILFTGSVYAHCDTLDGPVVVDAKKALENGNVTQVLKWVKKEHEAEIREMFGRVLAAGAKGAEVKELADMYFFETLVRIHRAGEGAPYTGLKPAGQLEFAIVEADKALETGNADELAKTIMNQADDGIRKRFAHAMEKKKEADKSVEAGREFVEAYVTFLHYAEHLYTVSKTQGGEHPNQNPEAGKSREHQQQSESKESHHKHQ